MTQDVIPAGTRLAVKAIQAGDPRRVVKLGDHSLMAASHAAPGVQAASSPAPQRPSGLQGLFKSFGLS